MPSLTRTLFFLLLAPTYQAASTPDACPSDLGSNISDSISASQQIAIAAYIHPLADPDAWNRLVGFENHKISFLIANILNGSDATVDLDWKTVIDRAMNSSTSKKVIGYVLTGYLGLSKQSLTTRLGSGDITDWISQIERDIDKWYQLYDSISGIFFDEGWVDCAVAPIYKRINDYIKRKHPDAFTVLNPDSPMPQCFEDTMDTLLTFEDSYEAYTSG